jgi:hypothetical protein
VVILGVGIYSEIFILISKLANNWFVLQELNLNNYSKVFSLKIINKLVFKF